MPLQWTTVTWLVLVGSLQIYILYASIFRYVNLKFEVFNGFLVAFANHRWILSLINFQLFVIISSLAILPLWLYSTLFSTSSLFCGSQIISTKGGFYQLVWNEALHVLSQHVPLELSDARQEKLKCNGNVRIALFYPVSNLLHVLMAYVLAMPLAFVEAWLIQTNDERKDSTGHSELNFFESDNIIIKIKCSIEYVNLLLSLLALSFQFSKMLWLSNRLFSTLLNIIQILINIHIIVHVSLFSSFTKHYYKHNIANNLIIGPWFILAITIFSDTLLILCTFSYFQFGFEKCVQSLLTSAWFNSINRADTTIPSTNNYEQSNCQSITSSSAFYSIRNVQERKNSLCPTISAAGLFSVAIGMKIIGCYEYWPYLSWTRLFIVYFVHSLVLVVAFLFIWFAICLKPDWLFKITEQQLTQHAIITYPEKVESNYYKSLGSKQGNSRMSFSVASNTNESVQSKKAESMYQVECASPNQYISNCMSLNLPLSTRLEHSDYLQLNNHFNRSNVYKPISPCNSMPVQSSPNVTNFLYKDFKRIPTPNHKFSTSTYASLRPNGSALSEESDDATRKLNTHYSIKEMDHETDFSSNEDEEVFLDSAQSLQKYNEQMKNSSHYKFVTFQLDTKPEMGNEQCSSSNDNLTITSLDMSEKFIRELENGVDNRIGYRNAQDIVNSLYVLERTVDNTGIMDSDL